MRFAWFAILAMLGTAAAIAADDPPMIPAARLEIGRTVYAFAWPADAKPGQAVKITVTVIRSGPLNLERVDQAAAVLILPAIAPAPTPGPDPGPTPGPSPAPIAIKLFAVVVEETAERGKLPPAQIAAIVGTKAAEYCRAKGHSWRVIDQDLVGPDGKPPASVRAFLDRSRGKKLPWLIVTDQVGTVCHEGELPTTEAALLALLKQWGG